MHHLIAWLYWNPPKEAFIIPFIERPIAWYGILFVSGFFLSYLILLPIFALFLRQFRSLSDLDILNWPLLVNEIKRQPNQVAQQVYQSLSPTTKTALNYTSLDQSTKQALLDALNQMWGKLNLTRKDFQIAFPKTIASYRQLSQLLIDKLCWFVVIGTLVGARLGLVFFYDWDYFSQHPSEIIKIWNGGLASHGGVIGIFIALYLYVQNVKKWIPSLTFLRITDFVAIPAALVSCFIRIGNFINQEILGTPTSLPWAVIFGNPIDNSPSIPRHPVQLYEAFSYFFIFVFLFWVWRTRGNQLRVGVLTGLLFLLVFTSRFFIEFWKESTPAVLSIPVLQMSQLLSLPFIALGAFLIWRGYQKKVYLSVVSIFS